MWLENDPALVSFSVIGPWTGKPIELSWMISVPLFMTGNFNIDCIFFILNVLLHFYHYL